MVNAAISARNLSIGYQTGKKEILVSRIPSLELAKGKLTCLLGPNGVGKSTLLKTITGNLDPLDGEIAITGSSLTQLTVKERAVKLAVVLTDKAHLGFTTVREMITLGRNPYTNWMNSLGEADSQAIDKALKAIGMSDLAEKPLAELSDGNLQKVIIGRAIAQETEMIVLDEPTVHLDISNKTIVIELLRELCQSHGKTILFSTHDLELAKLYADALWIMREDALIQGLTEDLVFNGVIEDSFNYKASGVNKEFSNLIVHGSDDQIVLLTRALTKAGFDKNLEAEIKISKKKESVEFELEGNSFGKLVNLLDYLSSRRIR